VVGNACAIGYKAITSSTNQFEVGNNNVSVSMGLFSHTITNVTRLELNTDYGKTPFTVAYNGVPPAYVNPGGVVADGAVCALITLQQLQSPVSIRVSESAPSTVREI
jgi:hypothetical protein